MLLALCLWGVSGSVVFAQTPIVQCGNGNAAFDSNKNPTCNFSALITMINNIINYLIMIALPLSAISFAYAGFLYLFSGGDTRKVSKAKTIFADVGIGLILVLSAWLVFKLIETTFLNTGNGYATYLN